MAAKNPGGEKGFIFRPWITLPNGERRWARDYGKKAWRIPVDKGESKNEKKS